MTALSSAYLCNRFRVLACSNNHFLFLIKKVYSEIQGMLLSPNLVILTYTRQRFQSYFNFENLSLVLVKSQLVRGTQSYRYTHTQSGSILLPLLELPSGSGWGKALIRNTPLFRAQMVTKLVILLELSKYSLRIIFKNIIRNLV